MHANHLQITDHAWRYVDQSDIVWSVIGARRQVQTYQNLVEWKYPRVQHANIQSSIQCLNTCVFIGAINTEY